MSELDQLYQAVIVDHDRSPRNLGPLAGATHSATVDNPLCGDIVTLHLRLDAGVIREISFEGHGCALSRAAASILTTMLRDRSPADTQSLAAAFEAFINAAPSAAPADSPANPAEPPGALGDLGDLSAFAGVRSFRSRRACVTLPFRALAAALAPAG